MNPTNFVTLLYLSDKCRFSFDREFDQEDYYIARQMPAKEMFGKNILELAEELIEVTTSVDWRRQQRRPIVCGDIICNGMDAWMYVEYADVEDKAVPMMRLKAWPRYAIWALPKNSVRETICNP